MLLSAALQGRGDSEASIEHQAVKNRVDGLHYLGLGRT